MYICLFLIFINFFLLIYLLCNYIFEFLFCEIKKNMINYFKNINLKKIKVPYNIIITIIIENL